MDTYTITFVDEEELGSDQLFPGNIYIQNEILKKFNRRQFQLADFNWSGNYTPENAKAYLNSPYKCNAVIEIRLPLDINIIGSRDAIYNTCLQALQDGKVVMKRLQEFKNDNQQKRQNLIRFEMPD